ncbi:transglutaminase-like domain-containing protein [uncultured Methanobrevibacter sp.]|uniref:transglutaminase-like domain-containing protein n=1 Tax=uncultured Methanobrevibacter sp. TaxID=253161 RepID=UPI0025EC76BF|nr:transglutaminase-like domain-containing protein [uncultured Methanobrevibacter sp.]
MAVTILPPFGISGFEVYETEKKKDKDKEKDSKKSKTDEKKEEEKKDTSKSTEENVSDAEKDLQKFIAMNGEIKEIAYYDEMYDNGFDEDYEGISNSGNASFPEVDTARFFKGKKICLKKANDTGTPLKWDDLVTCLLGFISEQTFSRGKVDLKLVGMSKLLDQEKQFTFTKTKRSKILKEMIEAAGLKCVIDVTGLKDDAIDYTNVSSSGSSGTTGIGDAEIDELVAKWCEGKTSDLDKAKAIHAGLRDDVGIWYDKYYNSRYHTPKKCLENHKHLNCGDTAILTCACMKSGGLNAHIELRCDSEHYFTVIVIDGTKYYSDLTWTQGQKSQRAWNDVWQDNKCGNKYDLK